MYFVRSLAIFFALGVFEELHTHESTSWVTVIRGSLSKCYTIINLLVISKVVRSTLFGYILTNPSIKVAVAEGPLSKGCTPKSLIVRVTAARYILFKG